MQQAHLYVWDDSEKLCRKHSFEEPFSFFHVGVRLAFFSGHFTSTVDQLNGVDVAMGERGDNACVECLEMKCVGAENLQWRAPFHYL